MPDCVKNDACWVIAAIKPLPFRGGEGGGGHCEAMAGDSHFACLTGPTPTPPLKGRGYGCSPPIWVILTVLPPPHHHEWIAGLQLQQ
jgi:hypothetical protein